MMSSASEKINDIFCGEGITESLKSKEQRPRHGADD